MAFSGNALLSSIKAYEKLRLCRWPDFGKVPHSPHTIKLASHLISHSASTDDLIGQFNINKNLIMNFLNACYLCGWLIVATEQSHQFNTPITQKPEKKRSRILFLIRKRLGFA